MAITEPGQFTTEKNKQAFQAIVFIDCDDKSKYWANELLASFNGHSYENELVNVSAISASVDRDGGLATVGGLTFDLTNLENYSDWVAGVGNIEGTEVKFYLVFNDGSALTFSESVQFFTGLIDGFEIDYDRLSISVSHYDLFIDEMVGELIEEGEYDDGYIKQLSSATGRMKPIVYGDHTYNGPKPAAQWNPAEKTNMVPAVRINENKWLIAGHEMGTCSVNDIWLYHNGLNRYFQVSPDIVTITNSGECIVELPESLVLNVYDFWLPHAVYNFGYSTDWVNDEYLIDNDLTTYTSINGTVTGKRTLNLKFKEYDYDGYTNIVAIRNFSAYNASAGTLEYWMLGAGGEPTGIEKRAEINTIVHSAGTCTVTTVDENEFQVGELVTLSGVQAKSGDTYFDGGIDGAYIITAVNSSTEFEFSFTSPLWNNFYNGSAIVVVSDVISLPTTTYGTPVDVGAFELQTPDTIGKMIIISAIGSPVTANIRCFYKRIELEIPFTDDFTLCAAGHGKKDGSSYIENPADVIKDIVTTWTDLTYADNFDTMAFTAAQTARTSWDFDFVLINQIKVRDLIHELAKASNIHAFWNNENKLKLSAYTQNPSYTANIDEFSEAPGVSGGSFNKNRIIAGTLQQRQTPVSELGNKIYVNYFADEVSGKFNGRITSENTTSQADYGVFELTFENKYIADDAVIELYAANLIDIFSYRMWLCQFEGSLHQ
ncbi:MAG: hypothetical protein JRJ62_04805 [Deltaproteobacteria bacterium]|nr:hypothetical protein [Deltaproteobacteria bacterium]